MNKLLFILLITLTYFGATAQTFSNNKADFAKEFDKAIRQATSENLRTFTKDQLGVMLTETNEFPDRYFEKMVNTVNTMLDKRLKIMPDVYNYVYSVYTIVDNKLEEKSYDAWHKAVDKLIEQRSPRKFKEFMDVSMSFFKDNIIAASRTTEWLYVGGDYTFDYDGDSFINFENGTLKCRTVNRGSTSREVPFSDSVVISNTKGIYNLSRERWEGDGGILTWEKAGLSGTETFAELLDYKLSMKSTSLNCDTVILKTPYFDQKIKGRLNDRAKIGSYSESRDIDYPQFESHEQKYEIADFYKDVDYVGGFSLKGNNFLGQGTKESPAHLTFYRNDKPFIKTSSYQVSVSDKKISAPEAITTIFVGLEDSIYHPGIDFSFLKSENEVQLNRSTSGIGQSPFVNSFHKLNMYVEQINWKRTEKTLNLTYNFSTSQQQRLAQFESFDYYDERLFEQLQGMESVNPLAALWNYAYKYDEYILSEGKAASALNRTLTQAKPTLLKLSSLGFISYDTEGGIVTLTEKLEHFVKSKAAKKDYDNISFISDLTPKRMDNYSRDEIRASKELQKQLKNIEERNSKRSKIKNFGTFDLSAMEIKLNAIDFVPISDKKNTLIFPEGNELSIKENRKIIFKGWINAGKWEIHIMDGNYVYEKHGFNIFESDLALFRVAPQKSEHGTKGIPTQSPLSGIRGELIVDDINNRSGEDDNFGSYPKLSSKEKTRVYYNQRDIQRGAYEKDRFYFEVDPFEMDSLLTFDDKSLRFNGTLTSAGIFPKFEEELRVMPDYSLGFSRQAPDDGYEFYGTEARYDNKIVLSNNGLQGSGQIDFVNSSSVSKAFTFLPDSTIGVAQFTNKPQIEGVQFPDVTGPDAFITFMPRNKVLTARSNQELLSFFDGEANLRGQTTVKEDGMTGNGVFDLDGASMTAKHYRFSRYRAESDTAKFNLVNKYKEPGDLTEDALAFKTDNIAGYIDFDERKGEFTSNDGTTVVEFPVNQYVCLIDMFTWLMDSDEVEMQTSEEDDLNIETSDLDLVGPNFFSVHPKQDSLQFRAPKAKYSLKEKSIYCEETKFIEVADARIYPDSAKVVIRKKARMETLENSTIVANYITKYHTIENASTKITARRAYTSEGDYPYYDIDSNRYDIFLPKIHLDTSYQTVASGKISDEEGFKLSPQFDFYGEVFLKAADPTLTFKGATRINHECEKFDRNWMSFSAPLDPQNIQIPVSESMEDLEGNSISAGIRWRHSSDPDSIMLYPTFLSSTKDAEDPVVISASGFLQYKVDANEFQIASKEKLNNRGEKGNYISLHTGSCSMNGDGVIDLGMDYGPLDVDAVGVVNYDQASEETSMNLTLKINAPMDEGIFEDVAERISKIDGLKDADFNSTTLEQAIFEWVDRETADKIKSDFTLDKKIRKVPKEMKETMVITGVRINSYKEFGDQQVGLKTSTDQAAIVNIYGEPVMKYVPLKLFAEQRTTTGDRLGLLFNVPGSNLYFFDYDFRKSGTMNILTSDQEMMNDINDLKADKRKDRKFMYQTTESSAYQSQFLRVFK